MPMRLARLTLQGFKSFADRTEFTFDEAVTGIVGPNGCGKSNVVDAIKWVLGERSSKSLRGKEMTDVIFAGSSNRKPLGMASVMLTFDNPLLGEGEKPAWAALAEAPEEAPEGAPGAEDSGDEGSSNLVNRRNVRRALPIDADAVEVERRLFRDGSSQYLINGRRARLKDIVELFLDTGVGADAYSIIEQGKVDAMLLASPSERRTIFEEAAGIAKFRQRSAEAMRKLERAEANLIQVREQLANAERRLRIVRGQAAKARRFVALDEELSALRWALLLEQYHDLTQRLNGLTSRIDHLVRDRDEAASAVAQLEALKQEAEIVRQERASALRSCEEACRRAEQEEQSARQRREMQQRSADEASQQAQALERESAELQRRLEAVEQERGQAAERVASLAESLAEAERALQALSKERGEAAQRASQHRAQAQQKRAAVVQIERERAALAAGAQADQRRIAQIEEEQRHRRDRLASAEGELSRANDRHGQLVPAIADRRGAIESLTRELGELDQGAERLGADRAQQARTLAELEDRHARLDGRRLTLHEMAQQHAGLTGAVRDALARREHDAALAKIVGVLSDHLHAELEHASAVEAALGPMLQALLVPSVDDVPPAGALATLKGRVTFVPLDGPLGSAAGGTAQLSALSELAPGHVTPVRRLVRVLDGAPESVGIERLLDRVLGSTVLVRDVEAAVLLRAGPLAGARFVTPDGLVLEADGRVTGGPMSVQDEAGGVLARRSELARLEAELGSLSGSIARTRSALAGLDQRSADLADRAKRVRGDLALQQRELAGDEARLEQVRQEMQRLERQRASLGAEVDQAEQRAEKLRAEHAALLERAGKLERLSAEESARADEAEGQAQSAQQALAELDERQTQGKVSIGRLAEQVSSARREAQRLEQDVDELRRRHRHAEQQAQQRRGAEERALVAVRQAGADADDAHRRADESRAQAAELTSAVEESAARATDLGERLGLARERARLIERDWHSVEVSRRELEVRREGLEQRAVDEAKLDLPLMLPEYRELIESGGVGRVDPDEAQQEADALKEEIRRLGSVNLDAIEEEDALGQRNEALVAQVADLDAARAHLVELIDRLNTVSRDRFRESFTRVQEHFAGPEGMFRKLFGGGRAELRLMPLVKEVDGQKVTTDEIDWLESGVEVIAKPPGKEPRSISQLSGGEKSMTAVALLMAIFRSKPSCFCVLDEVDAALDEANVERFCRVIRQFVDLSHFIVITHNRKTMGSCDQLFGVTMQERGVSKRVRVRLEQIAEDGRVREEPAGAAQQTDLPYRRGERDGARPGSGEAAGRPGAAEAGAPAPVETGSAAHADVGESATGDAPAPKAPRKGRGSLRAALAQMREESRPVETTAPSES